MPNDVNRSIRMLAGLLAREARTLGADYLLPQINRLAGGSPTLDRSRRAIKPSWAFIEITNNCNLNCLMCNTKLAKRKKGYMSVELFEATMDALMRADIFGGALHTVGETLLHPQLDELLSAAHAHNFTTVISTNGQLTGKLARMLTRSPRDQVKQIRFSIDAAEPETYELIRRGGKIDRVWESMALVADLNRRLGLDVEIGTNFVVSETNMREIDTFLGRMRKHAPLEKTTFCFPNSLSPDPSFLLEIFPFKSLLFPTPQVCRQPFECVTITFDGRWTLCCRDYDADMVVGKLQTSSLESIWSGPAADDIRQQLLGQRPLRTSLCAQCHSTTVGALCNPFIHIAWRKGVEGIGEKLWHILAMLDDTDAAPDDVLRATVEMLSIKAPVDERVRARADVA